MKLDRNVASFAFALIALGAGKAGAADAISPDATAVLKKVCATYAGAHSFSCKITTIYRDKQKKRPPAEQFVVAEKPNKYYIELPQKSCGIAVCDGKIVEYYFRRKKMYILDHAPPNIKAGMNASKFFEIGGMLDYQSLLPQLLGIRPFEEVMRGVSRASLAADEQIEGIVCQHIVLTRAHDTVDVWITKDKEPKVAQVRDLDANGDSSNLYQNQIFNAPINPTKFGPPHAADAVKVTTFVGDPHTLIGKPAPDVTLNMQDGAAIKLSKLRGRVVVLDFWMTDSEADVPMMTVCAMQSQRFTDRGVTFIPVNAANSEADVKAFMKKNNLSMPCAFDGQRDLADAFLADVVGVVIFIGKDGIIKGVLDPGDVITQGTDYMESFATDAKVKFVRDLEAVLAGKPIERPRNEGK